MFTLSNLVIVALPNPPRATPSARFCYPNKTPPPPQSTAALPDKVLRAQRSHEKAVHKLRDKDTQNRPAAARELEVGAEPAGVRRAFALSPAPAARSANVAAFFLAASNFAAFSNGAAAAVILGGYPTGVLVRPASLLSPS